MIGQILDFDNAITRPVSFYRGNHYDKTFAVKKNGVPLDWDAEGVIDIIVIARKSRKAGSNILELKKSLNNITTIPGYMTWHLTSDKTDIEPGDYACFQVGILYADNKPRIWWDSALKVKWRA